MIRILVVGIAFAAAQIGLGWMVWKYRETGAKDRALYTHGSNRLEMVWTVITAIIFVALAVLGENGWDPPPFYDASPGAFGGGVVAQQVPVDFFYPGKDGRVGKNK